MALAAKGAQALGPEDVVAVVDGRPISASEVAEQARASGVDARRALEALIDAEVVAGAAERRGLLQAPEVIEAMQQTLVRRLLATTFEREVMPEQLPDQEMRAAYARNRARLDHPELIEVRHVLARAGKKDDAGRREVLRRRAVQVAERAAGVKSADEFAALGPALSDAEVALRTETVVTARRGWTVDAFADAAFALPRDGAVSGVVETEFGYHVLYRVRRIAEEHISFDEARPKLRELLWPDFQRREFLRFAEALAGRHEVAVHGERLGEVEPGR
ncbi:MAG TPA: peptidyl-prolyl cis-trans isomerase [Polyangia bacterium]|nr:peptidyl-prolyl cis-trans isomerase [Polyangia bacterium]